MSRPPVERGLRLDQALYLVDRQMCDPNCLFADPLRERSCDCVCHGEYHGALRLDIAPRQEKVVGHIGSDNDRAECSCGWEAVGPWTLDEAAEHQSATGHADWVEVRVRVFGKDSI